MSARSKSRSSAPVLPMTSGFQQPISFSDHFCNPAFSSPETSSSSSFSAGSSALFSRSISPTRVSIVRSSPLAPSVRFAIDRPTSPGRSISAIASRNPIVRSPMSSSVRRKSCMCSPTTHPGSFRCSLHKGLNHQQVSLPSNRLNARRSAMTNSFVRIGTVEGELVKRALTALIRPSLHHQRRRTDFQPRPSRLSQMSKADDLC